MGREAADGIIGLQAEPLAHPRQVRVGEPAGEVGGGGDVRPARPPHRHPHRVPHHAAFQLVVADHGGKDRQPGRVGRGPAVGPQLVRAEIEHRRLRRLPAAVGPQGLVELVEDAAGGIDDDGVPVAALRGACPAARRPARPSCPGSPPASPRWACCRARGTAPCPIRPGTP